MNQKTASLFPALRFVFTSVLFLAFLLIFLSSCGTMRGMGRDGCPSQNISPAKASYRGR
jgi:predicted small secreted protein